MSFIKLIFYFFDIKKAKYRQFLRIKFFKSKKKLQIKCNQTLKAIVKKIKNENN